MNKIILTITFAITIVILTLVSCEERAKPIDFYKNKGIVVVEEPSDTNFNNSTVRCKDLDSTFYILIPDFDARDLKPGDTIK